MLALVFASVDAAQDAVIAEFVTWPEATYVSTLIGRADVYMQVIARDNRALWELIGRLRALEGVRDTETMIETQVHAFAYHGLPRPPDRSLRVLLAPPAGLHGSAVRRPPRACGVRAGATGGNCGWERAAGG